jgi:hypothetical protein
MLPNTMLSVSTKPVTRQVAKQVLEVTVELTIEQIRQAAVAHYGDYPIGTEGGRIPAAAALKCEYKDGVFYYRLVWDDEPAKVTRTIDLEE